MAEWCRLVGKPISSQVETKRGRLVGREDKIAQLAQFSKVGAGRGNKGGESEAARQLGLDRDDVRRAIAVVALFLAGRKRECYNLG